jgi:integral membrane protein
MTTQTFKKLAIAEGISFLIILGITMPLKYIMNNGMPNKIVGMIHGALFIYYCIAVIIVKDKFRWDFKKTVIALIASVIPFGTFYVEKKMITEEI